MENFNIILVKLIIRFFNSNFIYLKKFIIENFKEKCFIYVNINKCIFNISIFNFIVVEVDNN